jgi:hypothetical protein
MGGDGSKWEDEQQFNSIKKIFFHGKSSPLPYPCSIVIRQATFGLEGQWGKEGRSEVEKSFPHCPF